MNYNIVWEFTAFGESDLAGIVIVDGVKDGQKLVAKREMNKTTGKKTRKSKGEGNKIKPIKDNLKKCLMMRQCMYVCF
jgi:hypothetical protein